MDTVEKIKNDNKKLIEENKKLKAHILKLQGMVNDSLRKLKKEKYENHKLVHMVNKLKIENNEMLQKITKFFK